MRAAPSAESLARELISTSDCIRKVFLQYYNDVFPIRDLTDSFVPRASRDSRPQQLNNVC